MHNQNVTLRTIKNRDAMTVSPHKNKYVFEYSSSNLPPRYIFPHIIHDTYDTQYAINIGKFNTTLKYPHHYYLLPYELYYIRPNEDDCKKLWDYNGYNQFILMHNDDEGKIGYYNETIDELDLSNGIYTDVDCVQKYYNMHNCASALSINSDTLELNGDVLPTYNVDLGYCANNVSVGAPANSVTIGNCSSMTDDRFWPETYIDDRLNNIAQYYNDHGNTLKANAPKVYGEVHVGDYAERITVGNAIGGGIDIKQINTGISTSRLNNIINIGTINEYDVSAPYIGIGTARGHHDVPGANIGLHIKSPVPGSWLKIEGARRIYATGTEKEITDVCALGINNSTCELTNNGAHIINSTCHQTYSSDNKNILTRQHMLFIGRGNIHGLDNKIVNNLEYSTYISGIDKDNEVVTDKYNVKNIHKTGVHISAKPMLINNSDKKLIDDIDQYTMTIARGNVSIGYVYEYINDQGDTDIITDYAMRITRCSTDGNDIQTNVIEVGGSIMPPAGSNESGYHKISLGRDYSPFEDVYAKYLHGTLASESDERLKNFGDNITVDFDKLAQLRKAYFTWKDEKQPGTNIGMSAQEVQEIYPEIVHELENGTLTVEYPKLAVIALAAVDELHKKNKELEDRLTKIEAMLEKLT